MFEYLMVFLLGGAGYCLIEVLWRGFTHWSMALAGGGALAFIYHIGARYPESALWQRCAAGGLMITLVELIAGFVVNILLGWGVWDYSELPLNFMGQISALYSVLWFLICVPADAICRGVRRKFRKLKLRG